MTFEKKGTYTIGRGKFSDDICFTCGQRLEKTGKHCGYTGASHSSSSDPKSDDAYITVECPGYKEDKR